MMSSDRVSINTRITKVETIPLELPLATATRISQGAARQAVEIMIVRLHTDAGISGIGETQAWRRQGNAETLPGLTTQIQHHFTPHLIGKSPFDSASILQALDLAVHHSLYAQAAVADALCDLQARLLGIPAYMLLGGKCRDTIPTAGLVYLKSSLKETVETVERSFDQGMRSFTVKVGVDPQADIQNIKALREQFSDSIILRVDANAGMNFDSALKLLRSIEQYDIDAAEQLLPIWDMDGMAELARRTPIPLMADECVATDHDLVAVIKKRAATVVQTKIAKNGGMWRCLNLWRMANAAGMRIYPGNHPSTSVATLAAAHVAAAWPGPLLDGVFACGIGAIVEDIVTEPVRLEGNSVRVPDSPGLGVELDEECVKKWRVD
jgi:L-alanine-DL-glutamate epimerase-like enolase superfamily enzyme